MQKQLKEFRQSKRMYELAEAEQLVMAVIWNNEEPMNSYDIQMQVNKSFGIEWAITSICTFLNRIEIKGYLEYEKVGKYKYYYPLISKEEYIKAFLQEVCEIFKLPTNEVVEAATKCNK